jgi:hypothetical protein
LLEFLRDHPKSTVDEMMLALELPESTAYYALKRLRDRGLIRKASRWIPSRWRLVAAANSDFPKVPWRARRWCRPLVQADGIVRPTGTPITLAGGMQIIRIQGPQIKEPEYSHDGRAHQVATSHPWTYSRSNWQSMAERRATTKQTATEDGSLHDPKAAP